MPFLHVPLLPALTMETWQPKPVVPLIVDMQFMYIKSLKPTLNSYFDDNGTLPFTVKQIVDSTSYSDDDSDDDLHVHTKNAGHISIVFCSKLTVWNTKPWDVALEFCKYKSSKSKHVIVVVLVGKYDTDEAKAKFNTLTGNVTVLYWNIVEDTLQTQDDSFAQLTNAILKHK